MRNDPISIAATASSSVVAKEQSKGATPPKNLRKSLPRLPLELSTSVVPFRPRRGHAEYKRKRLQDVLASTVTEKIIPRKKTTTPSTVRSGLDQACDTQPLQNFYQSENLEIGHSNIIEVDDAYRKFCGLDSTAELKRDDGRWPEYAFTFVSVFNFYFHVIFNL